MLVGFDPFFQACQTGSRYEIRIDAGAPPEPGEVSPGIQRSVDAGKTNPAVTVDSAFRNCSVQIVKKTEEVFFSAEKSHSEFHGIPELRQWLAQFPTTPETADSCLIFPFIHYEIGISAIFIVSSGADSSPGKILLPICRGFLLFLGKDIIPYNLSAERG